MTLKGVDEANIDFLKRRAETILITFERKVIETYLEGGWEWV
jgi:hypothetical protein